MTVLMKPELTKPIDLVVIKYGGNPVLIQSTGINGNPSLIQSTFGQRHMGFQLVLPSNHGGIYHIIKNNDGPDSGSNPWKIGNNGDPIDQCRKYNSSLFDSE